MRVKCSIRFQTKVMNQRIIFAKSIQTAFFILISPLCLGVGWKLMKSFPKMPNTIAQRILLGRQWLSEKRSGEKDLQHDSVPEEA